MTRAALFITTVPVTLEAFLLPLAHHFRDRGWRVDALANGAAGDPHLKSEFDHRYDVSWSRNPTDPRNIVGAGSTVRRIVDEGRYDIVHVHTPIAAFTSRYALRSRLDPARPALIYTAHGFHFYVGQASLPHAAYRTMERIAAPWTDYLVTINSEDYEAARSLGGLPADRVRFIPGIGVDTTRFSPQAASAAEISAVRGDLGIAPDTFMLTMIAELAPVKRHAMILEALALLGEENVALVLVGSGPLESRLREKAFALGVSDRVRWAGYRRDVPAILAASDVAALVSEREGLPRSVLEAMASGKPIVGTMTRGITDAVDDNCGWLVPKDDVPALASAIREAATNRETAAAKGRAARQRAQQEFAEELIVAEYDSLYREALESHV